MVSGSGVTIGEGLFEGRSWTMGVVLLVTVGVGLLGCVCCIRSAPANWKCTCDKRTSGCMAAKRHDFEKHAKRDHQPPKRDYHLLQNNYSYSPFCFLINIKL